MSKLIGVGVLIAIVLSLVAYSMSGHYSPVVNNTDVGCYGGGGGTCERVNGTTYNATTERDVYVKFHVINNNAHVVFYYYIDGAQILWSDFTTVQADQNQSFMVHVPLGANYSYRNNSAIHHVEIREYQYTRRV